MASHGVAAIFTDADIATDKLNGVPCAWGIVGKDGSPMKEPPHPLLAQGRVRHVGDPVAMVIADSGEAARSAAERIAVEYRVLPAVTVVVAAAAPGAPQLYDDVPGNLCCDWAIGDATATDAAFARAHHIARIDLVNDRLVPNAMESRAALAEYEPATGDYTLYVSTQLPYVVRVLIGLLIPGIPERKLRVIAPDVGGGFGSKQVVYAEEALVTWAARKAGAAGEMDGRSQRVLPIRALDDHRVQNHADIVDCRVRNECQLAALRIDLDLRDVAAAGAALALDQPPTMEIVCSRHNRPEPQVHVDVLRETAIYQELAKVEGSEPMLARFSPADTVGCARYWRGGQSCAARVSRVVLRRRLSSSQAERSEF
jgi:xanthine dehydrogenase molybdopterin-binding subunit B